MLMKHATQWQSEVGLVLLWVMHGRVCLDGSAGRVWLEYNEQISYNKALKAL